MVNSFPYIFTSCMVKSLTKNYRTRFNIPTTQELLLQSHMGSLGLLILLLKCVDFLSWPVLALGYPLCASVQAIENDNISDTRNLISYWILLSLIYLFEFVFLKLLQWFQYWYYLKLMIVVCLVIPNFGRAAHVYKKLVRSCIYMNSHVVINKFRNLKRAFVKKEDFLMLAKIYITENGTEALEKLIASMITEQNLDQEVPTTEKNGTQQANTALSSLKSNEDTLSNIAKTEGMTAKYTEAEASPHISTSKKFQKERTCDTCQVTTTSDAGMNFHLHGRLHNVACEALEAVVKYFVKNNDKLGGELEKMINALNSLEQKFTTYHHPNIKQKNVEVVDVQESYHMPERTIDQENMSTSFHVVPKVQELQENSGTSKLETNNSMFICDVCDVICNSEVQMASHLTGRRHLVRTSKSIDG